MSDRQRWRPVIRKPGPEHRELARFHPNGTWTGTVLPGGMGPGSPEMTARGRARCEWIIDGLWLSCQFEQDQFVGKEKILTWKAQWIVGYDAAAGEYRAVGVDSNGVSFIFQGSIQGNSLIMDSMGDGPVRLRFTWTAPPERPVSWKNEMSVAGGPWQLIEEYDIEPER